MKDLKVIQIVIVNLIIIELKLVTNVIIINIIGSISQSSLNITPLTFFKL